MNIRKIIQEQLLLEKKIGQISSTIEVVFGFDIIKTKHAEKRKDFNKRELDDSEHTFISNGEMVEFVRYFKREIAEGIVAGDIDNETNFVIKSSDRALAMAIIAEKITGTYWKLIVRTVFRESEINQFRTGQDQLVYEK